MADRPLQWRAFGDKLEAASAEIVCVIRELMEANLKIRHYEGNGEGKARLFNAARPKCERLERRTVPNSKTLGWCKKVDLVVSGA